MHAVAAAHFSSHSYMRWPGAPRVWFKMFYRLCLVDKSNTRSTRDSILLRSSPKPRCRNKAIDLEFRSGLHADADGVLGS